jgi:DNA-directed RNA polymerase subunit RPC12/RpoP
MDIIFECPTCKQELSIDAEGAGSQIDCPACNTKVTVPNPEAEPAAAPAAAKSAQPTPPPAASDKPAPSAVINPMSTSAAAKESKHFSVPVHAGPTESLIAKPLPTLEVAAKETDRQMRIKSFRHSDHVEVGKDHFDEHLNQWLGKVGEQNIIKISTFSYTHQDLASRAWVTDYGVMVVYRG